MAEVVSKMARYVVARRRSQACIEHPRAKFEQNTGRGSDFDSCKRTPPIDVELFLPILCVRLLYVFGCDANLVI